MGRGRLRWSWFCNYLAYPRVDCPNTLRNTSTEPSLDGRKTEGFGGLWYTV
jgi:hypothetical protein